MGTVCSSSQSNQVAEKPRTSTPDQSDDDDTVGGESQNTQLGSSEWMISSAANNTNQHYNNENRSISSEHAVFGNSDAHTNAAQNDSSAAKPNPLAANSSNGEETSSKNPTPAGEEERATSASSEGKNEGQDAPQGTRGSLTQGKGINQFSGPFNIWSTLIPRSDPEIQALVIRNYKGGFHDDDSGYFFPTVSERYSQRIEEVNGGDARGDGLLWVDPDKDYVPVVLQMLPPLKYELKNPIAKKSLGGTINGLSEDLKKIEVLLDRPSDFEAAKPICENLYMRAKGNHLPRLTAVFLELMIRTNDMIALQQYRDQFLRALEKQDVNQFNETFFSQGADSGKGSELFEQYLESELSELIMYCVCVAWTTLDDLRKLAGLPTEH